MIRRVVPSAARGSSEAQVCRCDWSNSSMRYRWATLRATPPRGDRRWSSVSFQKRNRIDIRLHHAGFSHHQHQGDDGDTIHNKHGWPLAALSVAGLLLLDTENLPRWRYRRLGSLVLKEAIDKEEASAVLKEAVSRWRITRWLLTGVRHAKHLVWLCTEGGLTLLRAGHLLFYFTPLLCLAPLLYWQPERFSGTFHATLLWSLEQSGPTFIKLGQWASTRPDIFPRALTDLLTKLHNSVHQHSMDQTWQILEKSFGEHPSHVLLSLDSEPVGSGCIAQVYHGTIRSAETFDGHRGASTEEGAVRDVAIKVRHPGLMHTIERDLRLMHLVTWLATLVPGTQWLSLRETADQFGTFMASQVDMRHEAKNLVQFRSNFDNNHRVHFPEPIFASEEVLIEEYAEGIPVGFFLKHRQADDEIGKATRGIHKAIAETGLKAFLQMTISDNFIHSDLHPGNILVTFTNENNDTISSMADIARVWERARGRQRSVREENAANLLHAYEAMDTMDKQAALADILSEFERQAYEPTLILLDAGLITTLSDQNRRNFLDLFKAVAEGDGPEAARLMVTRSRTGSCQDQITFERQMGALIESVQKKTFQLASIRIGEILGSVMGMVRRHRVKIEADFTNLVVSMMVLEGLGRQLDPDLDLFAAALPTLRRVRADNLNMYTKNHGLIFRIWAFAETRDLFKHYLDVVFNEDNIPAWPGLFTV